MKYICLGYMDEKKWEAMSEGERNDFMDECFSYDDELRKNGHFVGGEALQSARNATTLRWRNGRVSFTDGPFAETKEQLGGILVLEATDLIRAIQLMSKHPSIRMGASFEIRPAADLTAMVAESERRRSTRGARMTMTERKNNLTEKPAGRALVLTRVLDAAPGRAFKAWTDPQRMARWWGPRGFTNPVCKLDVRPGGAIRIDMRAPDGTVYPMTGIYQEILEPERLVFTSAALDEEVNPLFEVLNTVTFAEQGGKTTLTLRARVVKSTAKAAPYLAGMEAGWIQSLDRLGEHLAAV